MKKLGVLLILIFVSSAVFSSGRTETTGNGTLKRGAELFSEGKLAEAAESFKAAAVSEDPVTSAAAYFNRGITQAMIAEQAQSPSDKRDLLEDAYRALKRAADLKKLPADRQKDARRNMEVIRERISKLPEEPKEGRQDEKQDPQNTGGGENSEQIQKSPPQEGQSRKQSGAGNPDREDLLQQQRELSRRTADGEENNEDLAEQQKALQKSSEQQDLNEAAINQAKAAEALKQGDRETAMEYQKAAERELAETEDRGDNSEMNDILDQEAENQTRRNRLDKTGGITDAERNW